MIARVALSQVLLTLALLTDPSALVAPLRAAPSGVTSTTPTAPVRLVTGTAEMGRGGRGAARHRATHDALVEAVWQRLGTWVSKERQTPALRRSLGQGVRSLIARYRTREIRAEGKVLTVRLEVTVDEQAVVSRLRALGVPVLSPGVLLLAHCDRGPVGRPLANTLRSAGIRPVTGPWNTLTIPAQVAAVRTRPEAALARARTAETRMALVASCHPEPAQAPTPGVTAITLRLLLTLHAEGAAVPTLWQTEVRATGLGPDEGAASRAALELALERLSGQAIGELPRILPPGPGRALPLQILGRLTIPAALDLAARIPREVQGVEAVVPLRLARGEIWLEVRTIHNPASLVKALSRLAPPEGLLVFPQILRPQGHIALSVHPREESP